MLEGAARESVTHRDPGLARIVLWVDLQTLYPLYFASYDAKGDSVDVGYWVGRFSEDLAGSAKSSSPGTGGALRVIDPVGAAFANPRTRESWRRESWEITSSPEPDSDVRRALSIGNLTKSR